MDAASLAVAKEQIERWLPGFRTLRTPFYEHLCRRVADDIEIVTLARHCREGQPFAWMLFNSVHYLLLCDGGRDDLARYYPTLTDRPLPVADVYPAFRAFCLRHVEALKPLLATRTVQTTVVERAVAPLLMLDHVVRRFGGPLSLIEIGASAGLLLLFDRYRYDFGPAGQIGASDAPVTIVPVFDGTPPPRPARMPAIAMRVGVDLNPLDPRDADSILWARANLPPDWPDAARRLRAALDLRVATPLDMRRADAVEVLPAIAAEPAAAGQLCVMHSFVLYQWPPALRDRLEAQLIEISRTRRVLRLAIENLAAKFDSRLAALPLPAGESGRSTGLDLFIYENGACRVERLGLSRGGFRSLFWMAGAAV